MENVALDIRNLNLYFECKNLQYQALFDVNITVKDGEFVGIIGESGSGKTQTVMSILGLSPKNSKKDGEIIFNKMNLLKLDENDLNKIRGNYISIALQDTSLSLNPYVRVIDQLIEPLVLHYGKSEKEATRKVLEILDILRIPSVNDVTKKYPYEFSGGQRQRFLIAMALSCNPKIFIADELTTSLDLDTQLCVLNYLDELKKSNNMSILFVSHDLKALSRFSDKIVVMYCGHIVEVAETKEFFGNTKHPYSKGLINSTPKIEDKGHMLKTIPGEIPQLNELTKGCPFCNRCERCIDKCLIEKPVLEDIDNHKVACFKKL